MPPVVVVPSTYLWGQTRLFIEAIVDSASPSLQERKKALRSEMKEKRRANARLNGEVPEVLAEVFLKNIKLNGAEVIASYSAIRDEVDPESLNEALRCQGHKIALPVVVGRSVPLIFRLYEPGDLLLANPLGVREPASRALKVVPSVLLIPLLAFDRARNRLGYGGGYYDRTIKRLRASGPLLTVGVAYSYQQVADIPIGRNDVPLDRIVTETAVF